MTSIVFIINFCTVAGILTSVDLSSLSTFQATIPQPSASHTLLQRHVSHSHKRQHTNSNNTGSNKSNADNNSDSYFFVIKDVVERVGVEDAPATAVSNASHVVVGLLWVSHVLSRSSLPCPVLFLALSAFLFRSLPVSYTLLQVTYSTVSSLLSALLSSLSSFFSLTNNPCSVLAMMRPRIEPPPFQQITENEKKCFFAQMLIEHCDTLFATPPPSSTSSSPSTSPSTSPTAQHTEEDEDYGYYGNILDAMLTGNR